MNPSKRELALTIRADRQAWRDLVAAVGPNRTDEPGVMGDWTFGDLAGHLAAWRKRACTRLEAAARGESSPPPWPAELEDDDSINAWIRDHDRDRSSEELIGEYDASFERLAAAVEALPDRLFDDAGTAAGPEGPAAGLDPLSHLHEEHEAQVRAWLRSHDGPTS